MRKHPEKYGVKHFLKFGDYNVGLDGNLLILPTYMQFLLDLAPEDVILEPIDMDELTRLAREALGKTLLGALFAVFSVFFPVFSPGLGHNLNDTVFSTLL